MSGASGSDHPDVPAEVIGGQPRSVPGRPRFAYVASRELSRAMLHRLGEILAWDYGAGARIASRGLPLRWRVAADGVGCDREAVGFDEPPGATPAGLTRVTGRDYLVPMLGDDGEPWRVLLGEASSRPRLATLLADWGVPATMACRTSAALHRVRILPPAARATEVRSAMLMWECCEPAVTSVVQASGVVLTGCPVWEYEIAVELATAASAAGRG